MAAALFAVPVGLRMTSPGGVFGCERGAVDDVEGHRANIIEKALIDSREGFVRWLGFSLPC